MTFFGIKGLAGWVPITEIPDYPNYCQLFQRNKIPLILYTNLSFHTIQNIHFSLIKILHILSNTLVFRTEKLKHVTVAVAVSICTP